MRLFLDTSVLLAASGSATGASRAVTELAVPNDWTLITSPWCIAEAVRNLGKLPGDGRTAWTTKIRPAVTLVDDAVAAGRPLIFPKAKDRPVLISALAAEADVLLTLDRLDFGAYLGRTIYDLRVLLPAAWLQQERATGRLRGL